MNEIGLDDPWNFDRENIMSKAQNLAEEYWAPILTGFIPIIALNNNQIYGYVTSSLGYGDYGEIPDHPRNETLPEKNDTVIIDGPTP